MTKNHRFSLSITTQVRLRLVCKWAISQQRHKSPLPIGTELQQFVGFPQQSLQIITNVLAQEKTSALAEPKAGLSCSLRSRRAEIRLSIWANLCNDIPERPQQIDCISSLSDVPLDKWSSQQHL